MLLAMVPMQAAIQPGLPQKIFTGKSFREIVSFDIDGDGIRDAVGIDEVRPELIAARRVNAPVAGYEPPVVLRTLGEPRGEVRVADVDEDGREDLVAQDGERVLWWKGGTPAVFQGTLTDIVALTELQELVDVDGDGHCDLRFRRRFDAPGSSAPATWIFYGDGHGSFARKAPELDPSYHVSKVMDLDGDGIKELLGYSWIATLDGSGRKIATVRREPLAGYVVPDFSGDGRPDALVDDVYDTFLYEQAADGSFVEVLSLGNAGNWGGSVSWVAQLDTDPEREVVIRTQAGLPLRVLDHREGGYAERILAPAGYQGQGRFEELHLKLAFRDADGDGIDDLRFQVASIWGANFYGDPMSFGRTSSLEMKVSSRLDGGIRSFSAGEPLAVTDVHFPREIALTDLDRDGRRDLLSLGGNDRALRAWLAGPGGSFAPVAGLTLAGAGRELLAGAAGSRNLVSWTEEVRDPVPAIESIENGAFVLTGKLHLIDLPASPAGPAKGLQFENLFTRNLSAFHPAYDYPAGLLGRLDVDGDGEEDLVLSHPEAQAIGWYRQVLTPGFGSPIFPAFPERIGPAQKRDFPQHDLQMAVLRHRDVTWLDVDHDGDADLITAPTYQSSFGNQPAVERPAALYRNTGGTFVREDLPLPGAAQQIVGLLVGNFDGNGQPDVLLVRQVRDITASLQTRLSLACDLGRGVTADVTLKIPADYAAAGDMDGDGRDDLVVASAGLTDFFGGPLGRSEVHVLRCTGGGSFEAPRRLAFDHGAASAVALADLDGDGRADLIHASDERSEIQWLPSVPAPEYPAFADWAGAHGLDPQRPEEDADGDGLSDLYEWSTGGDPRRAGGAGGQPGDPGEGALATFRIIDWTQQEWFFRQARPARIRKGERLTTVVEESSDLVTWSTVASEPVISLDPRFPGWEILDWTVRDYFRNGPDRPPQRYRRLKTTFKP